MDGVTAAGDGTIPPLRPGHARRIMTGAPVPDGADSVIPVELTMPGEGTVTLQVAVQPGQHVRHRGEDLRAGALLLCAGHRLHALDVGALAGQGIAQISVTRRPRVGILATGDEVRPAGEALKPGQIYDANTPAVAALIREFGGEPVAFPIVRDDADHLQAGLIQAGEAELDLLLTSAGVSMGDYDLVKQMLGELGTVDFWKVAIKPGKPLAFGSLRRTGHGDASAPDRAAGQSGGCGGGLHGLRAPGHPNPVGRAGDAALSDHRPAGRAAAQLWAAAVCAHPAQLGWHDLHRPHGRAGGQRQRGRPGPLGWVYRRPGRCG